MFTHLKGFVNENKGKEHGAPAFVKRLRRAKEYSRPQLNGPALLREFNGASRRKRITKTPAVANRLRQGFGVSRGYGVAGEISKAPQLNSPDSLGIQQGKRKILLDTPVK
jgi:hypothetical protein